MDYLSLAVQLAATGMTVVFSGLVLLFVLMSLFRYLEARPKSDQSKERAESSASPQPSPDALTPEMMAVISAAVTQAIGRKVRVKRIRYRAADSGTSWSRQGRVTIMGSHRVRN